MKNIKNKNKFKIKVVQFSYLKRGSTSCSVVALNKLYLAFVAYI